MKSKKKLLECFREMLNQAGTITRAWFTSFNLSPAFVEGYILPALCNMENRPKSAADFEIIQETINKQGMDIRFFCDGRMAELNEGKKTAVPFHLIRPEAIGKRFSNGVFHPKVILLQNDENEAFLMTGSANLTVGGWAHNRECLFWEKISGKQNAETLEGFFKTIFKAVSETFPEDLSITTTKEEEKWLFAAPGITTDSSFLETFLDGSEESLLVWSPYFADPLDNLINGHLRPRLSAEAKISIIPDLSDQKLRMKNLPSTDVSLCSFDYNQESPVNNRLNHAKVWCTENRCAIGSWNMTAAALGLSDSNRNNIEAGVILASSKQLLNQLRDKSSPIEKLECMDNDELDQEKPDLDSSNMPYDIRVSFDWVSQIYHVLLQQQPPKGIKIKLPDMGQMDLTGKEQWFENPLPKKILKDRLFFLSEGDHQLQCGVIIEINTPQRPAWRFSSLGDFFSSHHEDLSVSENRRLSYVYSPKEASEKKEADSPPSVTEYRFSYFTMFRAFEMLRSRIAQAQEKFNESPNQYEEYIGWLKTYPGSVIQVAQLIKDQIDKETDDSSSVFNWFLVQEANSLLNDSIAFLKEDEERWKALIQSLEKSVLTAPELKGNEKVDKYTKYILETYFKKESKNVEGNNER